MSSLASTFMQGFRNERISYVWPRYADYKAAPSSIDIPGVGTLKLEHTTETLMGETRAVNDSHLRKPMFVRPCGPESVGPESVGHKKPKPACFPVQAKVNTVPMLVALLGGAALTLGVAGFCWAASPLPAALCGVLLGLGLVVMALGVAYHCGELILREQQFAQFCETMHS